MINTTQGGAHIKGTTFIPLSSVISDILTEKNRIKLNWYECQNKYNVQYVEQQIQKMKDEEQKLDRQWCKLIKHFVELIHLSSSISLKKLENQFVRFDKEIKHVIHNVYFKVFIEPMVRVRFRKLLENNQSIKLEKNLAKKGGEIVKGIWSFS